MTAIKIVLIALLLVLCVWAFRNRKRVGMRASARLALAGLAGLAIASVLDPNLTTTVARHLGVGRGTDLVLYLLVIAFAFTSAGLYFRSRELERKLGVLVRHAAVREAIAADGPPARLRADS